jgi:hypothetical protein
MPAQQTQQTRMAMMDVDTSDHPGRCKSYCSRANHRVSNNPCADIIREFEPWHYYRGALLARLFSLSCPELAPGFVFEPALTIRKARGTRVRESRHTVLAPQQQPAGVQ